MAYNIESPDWINRAFVINWLIYNQYENNTYLFCTNLATDLKNVLFVELSDIYKGLCCQQKFVSCVSVSDKHIYFSKSESHLLLALNLCESHEKDVIDNCSRPFLRAMAGKVSSEAFYANVELNTKRRSTAYRQNSVNVRNEQKCLLYCRSVENYENKLDNNFNEETRKVGM